jgi:adenine phosphoribosyltransferase
MASADLRGELIERISFVGGHADVWRVFSDGELFGRVVGALADPFCETGVTKVAGIEARGFILGAAVARELGIGFVPIRKSAGLFPGPKAERRAPRDYRGNEELLRIQRAALEAGDAVLLVDDWFETGSQAHTARELVEECGARVVGASVIVDQLDPGREHGLGLFRALVRADELDDSSQ